MFVVFLQQKAPQATSKPNVGLQGPKKALAYRERIGFIARAHNKGLAGSESLGPYTLRS
jgi:hypothetical protein